MQIKSGDEIAFKKLFKFYDAQISGYIMSITRSQPLTEEIVQDVFLKIWLNRKSLSGLDSFKSYLFIIAKNHTFDCLKQINRKKKREKEWMNMAMNHLPNDYGESALDNSYEKIQEAVKRLPPQQKKVYELRREGMKQAKIAEELSLSLGTVKKHLMLASRFLKNQIKSQALVN
ncbi:MAG: sigma-70 family RNA polymerase sigma factor [Bacteroidetes bacterium]|nr:sigma-70 family RNA polymerase sigma factor [Bacteroidota bacterium]